jgi:hypothetical protein
MDVIDVTKAMGSMKLIQFHGHVGNQLITTLSSEGL